ncbi:MAG: isochorismate synthase [Bacteroidetes bacterium]|nr:isochorismate synthase [Bacteroidota bacterium]
MTDSSATTAQAFFDYCVVHQLPFAFYQLPSSAGNMAAKLEPMVVAQNSSVVHKLSSEAGYSQARGFMFAPFHEYREFSKVLIQPDVHTLLNALPSLDFYNGTIPVVEHEEHAGLEREPTTEKEYSDYISRIKVLIAEKKFSKVVAARSIEVKKPADFHPVAMFEKLCKEYPTAFVSLVSIPEYGLWIGATPELLLRVKEEKFTTYSMAGTQSNSPKSPESGWGDKEVEEQELVSIYIGEAFQKVIKRQPVVAKHGTVQAGNVIHLQTEFELSDAPLRDWQKLVDELHPTPAVAGLPKEEAISFILKNENSEREFYAGFLGPINFDEEVHLFVNLRCMKVLPHRLQLFVGAGITLHSQPKYEWRETNMKAKTLLRVIQQMFPQAELF